ncbi:MAG TPA: hypothetical protein IGR64_12790 [Leptolyngbyaceae cyanobacterium M65_K2018_010]|nr:hypothetical protein [Leptolyngbyaceae cyanobacterium M65_K2018_010]
MPQTMQGILIALLIIFLIGIIIGFYLRQGRVNELSKALKESQDRNEALQQEHEERLRDATAQLQQDYEAQLAEKVERYQSQYEEQLRQLEVEYQARQSLIAPGTALGELDPAHSAALAYGMMEVGPISDAEQRIRKQYEARLKEAAHKIQQAYEQHLRTKLAEARETYQQEFDQRLAQAVEHYQDEMNARLAQATSDQALMQIAVGSGATAAGEVTMPPTTGEPTAAAAEHLAILEAELRAEYDQRLAERIEQYQDEMTQRTAQLEQEFAARLQMAQAAQPDPAATLSASQLEAQLRRDIEATLRAEYDQRLAEKIEQYQDELSQRTRELEEGLQARLQFLQSSSVPSPVAETPVDPGSLDLGALTSLEGLTMDGVALAEAEGSFNLDHLDELLDAVNPEAQPTDDLLDSLDDLTT